MNKERVLKDLRQRENDSYIKGQYLVSYDRYDTNRYKRVDELDLQDGNTIKATLSPLDMSIITFGVNTPFIVRRIDENRIDNIAFKIYGKSSMYWVLCYANNIEDPYKIRTGDVLLAPDFNSLFEFPNPLY